VLRRPGTRLLDQWKVLTGELGFARSKFAGNAFQKWNPMVFGSATTGRMFLCLTTRYPGINTFQCTLSVLIPARHRGNKKVHFCPEKY
jgi:hypothetical protein